MSNRFTDDDTKLHEHGRLLQKYLRDLEKLKQKEEEMKPLSFEQTRALMDRAGNDDDAIDPRSYSLFKHRR